MPSQEQNVILCGLKQISNAIQSAHKLPANDSQFALGSNSLPPAAGPLAHRLHAQPPQPLV